MEPVYWAGEEDTCHWRNIANTLLDLSWGSWEGKKREKKSDIVYKGLFYRCLVVGSNIWVCFFADDCGLTCAGLPAVLLELFFVGIMRSRAAFQPCWWRALPPSKQEPGAGSTFSFPTEIQGHQSLCWARGSNAFLCRGPSWNTRSRSWNTRKPEKILAIILVECE